MNKSKYRETVKAQLAPTVEHLRNALKGGKNLKSLKPILERLGRGGELPHWYATLEENGTFPNLDGKTVGSIIEMLFVSILEKYVLVGDQRIQLSLSPAKGIDIPDIDLGIKSPSTNFCTSEPFYSAYERILGNPHDMVVLLTDYQESKKISNSSFSILDAKYLKGSEVADKNLCELARKIKKLYTKGDIQEVDTKKCFRFLAYVIQSSWSAKVLLKILDNPIDSSHVKKVLDTAFAEFDKKIQTPDYVDNASLESDLQLLKKINATSPIIKGVIDVIDEWVIGTHKDFARIPNDSEWNQFLNSDLDGKIGMSFALQWRYNFSSVFPETKKLSKR